MPGRRGGIAAVCLALAAALPLVPPHQASAKGAIVDFPFGATGPVMQELGMPAQPEERAPIQVGPGRTIKLPSQAAAIVQRGDIIEIDAGAYVGDVAVWRADNLTIRGVGGRARLLAAGESAEQKAIWVIKGRNAVVENIEFAEAEVPAGNGAGIRAEGANLRVVNCYFHDNQEGILSSIYMLDSEIEIDNSEFARDGGNGGQSHEIYISNLRQLTVRGSWFHEGRIGHLIKSRAQRNLIVGNRITDEASGTASYEIDFPNGGFNIVAGNLIEQGELAQNSTMIANGLEGATNALEELYVVNNTFVNDLGRGIFVRARAPSRAALVNNIFVGSGNVLVGAGRLENNLLAAGFAGAPIIEKPLFHDGEIVEDGTMTASNPGLLDVRNYDYRLRPDSPAIGRGIDPGEAAGVPLLPTLQYRHPAQSEPVNAKPPIDLGAYPHAR
jgi:hypothetical protein